MIETHCHTCDRPLIVTLGISDDPTIPYRVTRHTYNECICLYTEDDLRDIVEDGAEWEM